MNKRIKQSTSLLLAIILVGCASIATHPTAEHIPITTEKAFALTKAFGITAEAQTQMEASPKNGATVTSIVATKFALDTDVAEAMTIMPTLTPTLAIPMDSPLCRPIDLNTSVQSGPLGAMAGAFSIGVGFTNISSGPCYLKTWPQIVLFDGQGKPLDLDYGYFDTSGVDANVAATEQARDSETAKVGLWPNWVARLSLVWSNWCGAPVSGGVVIRLTLPNQFGISIPTGISAGGTCNDSSYRSYVGISNLNVAPPAK
jgi:hypothetical protein